MTAYHNIGGGETPIKKKNNRVGGTVAIVMLRVNLKIFPIKFEPYLFLIYTSWAKILGLLAWRMILPSYTVTVYTCIKWKRQTVGSK